MQLRRIEEASLNAWPALQQMLYDGWLARFANGYTKRANSITPLYPATEDLHAKIAFCEQLYQARDLSVVFRLSSFAAPPDLDPLLAERGYRFADETLVLARPLATSIAPLAATPELHTLPLDEWLPIYSHLSGATASQERTHRSILEAILDQRLLYALKADGEIVACGVGVLEDTYFGLFDIVTAPAFRRRGYGTQLISGMLTWAAHHGSAYAYLQVVGANHAARHLYEHFGFEEAYRYWYRIRET
jgi:N-acetylglutamate synthase